MELLKNKLKKLMGSLIEQDRTTLESRLESLDSVFPFSEHEFILMFLIDRKVLTFDEYEEIRIKYMNSNKFLYLFGLAPRVFGEIWGQEHLIEIDGRFEKPSKDIDSDYDGEYDLWVDGVKVEVKACRAINTKIRSDLMSKALKFSSKEPFWMNFQQLKPDSCDVFIFIGVWVDQIVYWVLSSQEASDSPYISHQHRGGIEYQIGIKDSNIKEFDAYKVSPEAIIDTVLAKGKSKAH